MTHWYNLLVRAQENDNDAWTFQTALNFIEIDRLHRTVVSMILPVKLWINLVPGYSICDVLCWRNRVNLSHGLFSHTIDDYAVVAEMPRPLLSAMAVDKLDTATISAF